MFLGLPVLLETRLELALFGRDDEDCNVCLAGSHDHIGHVVLVAWGIEEGETLLLEGEVELGELTGLSVLTLLGDNIGNSCLLPCLHLVLRCVLLGFVEFQVVYFLQLLHDVTGEGRLSGVDVANEDDVGVILGEECSA